MHVHVHMIPMESSGLTNASTISTEASNVVTIYCPRHIQQQLQQLQQHQHQQRCGYLIGWNPHPWTFIVVSVIDAQLDEIERTLTLAQTQWKTTGIESTECPLSVIGTLEHATSSVPPPSSSPTSTTTTSLQPPTQSNYYNDRWKARRRMNQLAWVEMLVDAVNDDQTTHFSAFQSHTRLRRLYISNVIVSNDKHSNFRHSPPCHFYYFDAFSFNNAFSFVVSHPSSPSSSLPLQRIFYPKVEGVNEIEQTSNSTNGFSSDNPTSISSNDIPSSQQLILKLLSQCRPIELQLNHQFYTAFSATVFAFVKQMLLLPFLKCHWIIMTILQGISPVLKIITEIITGLFIFPGILLLLLDSARRLLKAFHLQSTSDHFRCRQQMFCNLYTVYRTFQDSTKAKPINHFHSLLLTSYAVQLTIDVAMGILIGFSLNYYRDICIGLISHMFPLNFLEQYLIWMSNNPAGIKLNTELSSFFTNILLSYMECWFRIVGVVLPYHRYLFTLICLTGCIGCTSIIAFLDDLLSLSTVHISIVYRIFLFIYSKFLSISISLWHLFRGRKKNVLHSRVDHHLYDSDQLIIGILMFAVVVFLLPTVAIYYMYFALLRVFVLCLHALLWWCSAFFYCFPFTFLFLYSLFPASLPAGVMVTLDKYQYATRPSSLPTTYESLQWSFQPLNTSPGQGQMKEQNQEEVWDGCSIRYSHRLLCMKSNIPNASLTHMSYLNLKIYRIPFTSLFFQYSIILSVLQIRCSISIYCHAILFGENLPRIPNVPQLLLKIKHMNMWKE